MTSNIASTTPGGYVIQAQRQSFGDGRKALSNSPIVDDSCDKGFNKGPKQAFLGQAKWFLRDDLFNL